MFSPCTLVHASGYDRQPSASCAADRASPSGGERYAGFSVGAVAACTSGASEGEKDACWIHTPLNFEHRGTECDEIKC